MKKLSPSQEIALQKEIDKLQKSGGGDYERLIQQVDQQRHVVQLNLPQLMASMSRAATLVLEWGRGTGKTTILGNRIHSLAKEMPRSTGLFIGPTYQAILTRIVPSLVQGLEMFGLYQDLHYFIGQRPPQKWRQSWGVSYQPPRKYDNYITFWNGMGIHLISQDVPGDGRGLNTDFILGDEAALLDARKIQENTDPTLRGTNTKEFQRSYLFGSRMYLSSTPLTPEGAWVIDYEDKAAKAPKEVNFISATCEHNLHNLKPGYLEDGRKNTIAPWVFDAEYLNIRPKFNKDSFYLLLDPDKHLYNDYDYTYYNRVGKEPDCRGDADLVKGLPLIVGVDWGAAINSLTVNQHIRTLNEYRTLKSMYVLGENQETQDDLIRNFCAYYQHHDTKVVYLWYDNTGNNRTGNTKLTRAEQARDLFKQHGWSCHLMTTGGSNPHHELKYQLWQIILKEDRPGAIRYRINRGNCRELYLSMRNARTAQGRNGEIKKDKTSERKTASLPRQEATDLSDANDSPIFGMFHALLQGAGAFVPMLRIR
jgi:hypothetical protein